MGSLYVVSDIHGYRDDLERALDKAGITGDDELWILGDLMDRGPDGIGAMDLAMSLQRQAPDNVHVLMGNHEILALGRYRFPHTSFARSWRANGGKRQDQAGLTDEHVAWLAALPLMGLAGDFLLLHQAWHAWSAVWDLRTLPRHRGILLVHSAKGYDFIGIAGVLRAFVEDRDEAGAIDNRAFAWNSDLGWHEKHR